jgi:hypothetical protein
MMPGRSVVKLPGWVADECLGQVVQLRPYRSPDFLCVGIQTPVYHRAINVLSVLSSQDGTTDSSVP